MTTTYTGFTVGHAQFQSPKCSAKSNLFNPQNQPHEANTVISLILQMRKPKHRVVKVTPSKKQCWYIRGETWPDSDDGIHLSIMLLKFPPHIDIFSLHTHRIKVKVDAIVHVTYNLKYSESRAQRVWFGLKRFKLSFNSLLLNTEGAFTMCQFLCPEG